MVVHNDWKCRVAGMIVAAVILLPHGAGAEEQSFVYAESGDALAALEPSGGDDGVHRFEQDDGLFALPLEKKWSLTVNARKDETRVERSVPLFEDSGRESVRFGFGLQYNF